MLDPAIFWPRFAFTRVGWSCGAVSESVVAVSGLSVLQLSLPALDQHSLCRAHPLDLVLREGLILSALPHEREEASRGKLER